MWSSTITVYIYVPIYIHIRWFQYCSCFIQMTIFHCCEKCCKQKRKRQRIREFLYFYFSDNKIYNLDLYFIVFMFGIFELIFNFVWIFNQWWIEVYFRFCFFLYIFFSSFLFLFLFLFPYILQKSLHRKTVWKFRFHEKIFRY